jgi:hypothetical protein
MSLPPLAACCGSLIAAPQGWRRVRAWLVALLAALLSVPIGLAAVAAYESTTTLAAGEQQSHPLSGSAGDSVDLQWDSSAPIDVFVQDTNATSADTNATPRMLFSALGQANGRGHVTLSGVGPWALVLDNTDQPPGGGTGTDPATVQVHVAPSLLEVPVVPAPQPQPQPQPDQDQTSNPPEAPTLWNTLLFDAPQWAPVAGLAFGSVALWMIVFLVVALIGFASPVAKVGVLALAATLLGVVWALLPHSSTVVQVGLPLLAGVGLGWLAVCATQRVQDAARLSFVPAILGGFAGVALAYGLRSLWSSPGTLAFGLERFADVLFTLPLGALLGVVLFKVIPDIVHALEEANADEAVVAPTGASQGAAFQVTCLRCRTEINVDRSMKRFRVATDRFEFACPNCQYWMEWAEPGRPSGAAAA